MSGHNKWSQIKYKKAKEDGKKSKIYTKLIKEITVCAKTGGGDPDHNATLRFLLEQARTANMPMENATRAIKRGTGELPGIHYEAFTYEGHAKNGITIMVDTLSDNKNRTVAELRKLFLSHGGHLGESGSVAWMFDHIGVIQINEKIPEEILLEKLLDFEVTDIKPVDDGTVIFCNKKALEQIRLFLKELYPIESAQFEWVAKSPISLSENEAENIIELLSELEDHDDVQNVYSNLA
jgi:YebC/PmpR family DNA-binding regulatory protein